MKILAVETSCDETALALIEAKGDFLIKNRSASARVGGWQIKILKNLVASQIKIHRPFGGVVPNLAKREHLRNLPLLWQRIMNKEVRIKNKNKKTIIHNSKFIIPDLIVVTVGPGLEPALWTGINFAKELQKIKNKKIKIVGANHLEGHLYSFLLEKKIAVSNVNPPAGGQMSNVFPAIALLVSGGHTILVKMDSLVKYKKIGETRDDAIGEAFDKVARLLNLPYPGGPEIEKLAKKGNSSAINFPRPMLNQKNYDFSFSGLKTAILYYLRDNKLQTTNYQLKTKIAASFQQAAFDVLIKKTLRAANEFKAKSIFISGGVAANKTLQQQFKLNINPPHPPTGGDGQISKVKFFAPSKNFCGDNAAMIAVAGYINYLQKKNRRLIANGNLGI